MLERRQYVRARAQIQASVTPSGGGTAGATPAPEPSTRVVDISLGGMMLVLGREYQPGTELTITLNVDGAEESVQCSGRVVWHDGDQMGGVEIVEVAPQDRDRINDIVMKLCQEQADGVIIV